MTANNTLERTGEQRVIYRVVADETLFQVASITAHDYRRP